MSKPFNPYREWLSIPDHQQPPTHYRLLGVENFESDPTVIANAADRAMLFVRTFQTGQHSAESQQLLNEISAARVYLLNEAKRREYDMTLCGETPAPAETPKETPEPERVPDTAFVPVRHSVELELPDESPIQIEGADKHGVVPNWERPKPKIPPSRFSLEPSGKPESETPEPEPEHVPTPDFAPVKHSVELELPDESPIQIEGADKYGVVPNWERPKPKLPPSRFSPAPSEKPEEPVEPETPKPQKKPKPRRKSIFTGKNFLKLFVWIEKRLPSMETLLGCTYSLIIFVTLVCVLTLMTVDCSRQRVQQIELFCEAPIDETIEDEPEETYIEIVNTVYQELESWSSIPKDETIDIPYPDFMDDDLVVFEEMTRQTSNLNDYTQIRYALYRYPTRLTTLLQTLDLYDRDEITDTQLEYLKGLTRLRDLDLSGCIRITDTGLAHLKGLTQLQKLNLSGCDITDIGLEHLKGLTELRVLGLRECKKITNAGAAKLNKVLPKCRIER